MVADDCSRLTSTPRTCSATPMAHLRLLPMVSPTRYRAAICATGLATLCPTPMGGLSACGVRPWIPCSIRGAPLGRGYRGPTIYGRRSLGLARFPALLRRRSCSRLPRGSSCCRAACAPLWALRSKGRVWRPSSAGLEIERLLKKVPSVEAATVNADRIVGKPYLEIHIDREALPPRHRPAEGAGRN